MRAILCACLALLAVAGPVHADLFDRAVDELFDDINYRRSFYNAGQSLIGGVVTRFPVTVSNPDPTNFRISTPCGSWSLTPKGVLQNLKEMLDPDRLLAALTSAIQDSIQNLIGAAVSKLSMMTVCYAVPTLCDLTKHMQAVAGQLHNVRSLSCQQLEGMVGNIATSLTAGRTARCVQAQIGQGMSLNVAQRICASGEWEAAPSHPGADQGWGTFGDNASASIPGGSAFPDDPMPLAGDTAHAPGQRKEQLLIRDTLKVALKDSTMTAAEKEELLEFQHYMIGDITVRDVTADGSPAPGEDKPAETQMDPKMPEYKLHDYYKSEFSRMDGILECAVNTFGPHTDVANDPTLDSTCSGIQYALISDTNTLSGTTSVSSPEEALETLSIPGFPLPMQGLRGLYELRQIGDTDTYVSLKGKIAGTLALMRSVWRTRELRDELETGMIGSKDQTAEEREQIVKRMRRLEREAERMIESRDTAERFMLPTVQAIVQHREAKRAEGLGQAMSAPAKVEDRGILSGLWNSFGYRFDGEEPPP